MLGFRQTFSNVSIRYVDERAAAYLSERHEMKPFGRRMCKHSMNDIEYWPITEPVDCEFLTIPCSIFLLSGYQDVHARVFPLIP